MTHNNDPSTATIKATLQAHFPQALIRVQDDTAMHKGHAHAHASGQGSHFTVHLRCVSLRGLTPLKRHRLVYDVLKPYFENGMHAVVMDVHDDQAP